VWGKFLRSTRPINLIDSNGKSPKENSNKMWETKPYPEKGVQYSKTALPLPGNPGAKGFFENVLKEEVKLVNQWVKDMGKAAAQAKFLSENRTPGLKMGTGLFDIKNRVPRKYQQIAAEKGNYNFGYVGTKLGIPPNVLLRGAGTAQLIGDAARGVSLSQLQENLMLREGDNDYHDRDLINDGILGAYRSNSE
jgi:hypothetical protein